MLLQHVNNERNTEIRFGYELKAFSYLATRSASKLKTASRVKNREEVDHNTPNKEQECGNSNEPSHARGFSTLGFKCLHGRLLTWEKRKKHKRKKIHAVAYQVLKADLAASKGCVRLNGSVIDCETIANCLGDNSSERRCQCTDGSDETVGGTFGTDLNDFKSGISSNNVSNCIRNISNEGDTKPEPLIAEDIPNGKICRNAVDENDSNLANDEHPPPIPVKTPALDRIQSCC
mmetsp:Transcript_16098/g.31109  ORF Transcript_16098/g.31109 Transcript_16098/m.31109 type:complete len:233 (+) Transcript_16098:140-838(+)